METTFLIDPFLGPSNPPEWMRAISPAFGPVGINQLGELDAVTLTHEHNDHADPDALRPIGQLTEAKVIGPVACIDVARQAGIPDERATVLAHGETVVFRYLRLTAVPVNDPAAQGSTTLQALRFPVR